MRTPLTFRKILPLCLAFFCLIVTVPLRGEAAEKTRVILDSDMVEMFDDGVAMLMLLQSPQIELMGVTIVTGNTWAEAGTANAIRQLEGLGRDDIPVVVGTTPMRIKERFAKIKDEYRRFGRGHDVAYAGAADFPEPSSWQAAYRARFSAEPTLSPVKEDAADFIIRTVRENPGNHHCRHRPGHQPRRRHRKRSRYRPPHRPRRLHERRLLSAGEHHPRRRI